MRALAFATALTVAVGAGCGAQPRPSPAPAVEVAALVPADLDALVGAPWIGTLTYLDYTSAEHTTIDSSLVVRKLTDAPPSWEFATGYAKEPQADVTENVVLSPDGRALGDERVVERRSLPGGGVFFVTETTGDDDDRPATFRFEHSITPTAYSRRKMVRFEGEAAFFERHIYEWKRPAVTAPAPP